MPSGVDLRYAGGRRWRPRTSPTLRSPGGMAVITSTKLHSRTTGTADTLIEVGRFLLEARAASRRAAVATRNPSPRPPRGSTRRRTPSGDRLRKSGPAPGWGMIAVTTRTPRTKEPPMPPPSVPLEKLGFLTIGLSTGRSGSRARDDPARSSSWASSSASTAPGCATGTCSTASPPPSPCSPPPPSAPGGSSWARRSSRWAGRTRCGWPRTSRPSTSCRAAGSTRASASGRRCATTTSATRSTRTPPTSRTSARARVAAAALRPRRAGQPVPRHRRDRGVLRPRRAALPRPGRPHVVRRGKPAVGAVGRRARHELLSSNVVRAEQSRRTSRRSSGRTSRRSGPTTRPARGPRVAGPGGDPDRLRDPRAGGEVRGVRAGPHAADARRRRARRG